MQRKKCFGTPGALRRRVLGYGRRGFLRRKVLGYGCWGVVVTIVVAALTLASNAASSQSGGETDSATAGETPALRPAGAAGFQPGGEPDRAGTYNILHLFTWAQLPTGSLIFDAAGNLYGTTVAGGAGSAKCGGGCGAVWKLARNPKGTWTVSILHAFTGGADGAAPTAGLIFDGAGNLYGTTELGGSAACDCGVVFELAPNSDGTWTESVLHRFTIADGFYPNAGLTLDTAGNLYGTTTFGGAGDGGVVFKLAPNPDGTWTESVLYTFTGGAAGAVPTAGVIFDATGNLFGTTAGGGSAKCGDGCGAVWKLARNLNGTWMESILHAFTGADGKAPFAGLTFDAAGKLYGTTGGGGYDTGDSTECFGGCGVVFKLSPSSSGWSETVLRTFIGFGRWPMAPVIFDRAGNLYGTASDGNHAFDHGLVFEITR